MPDGGTPALVPTGVGDNQVTGAPSSQLDWFWLVSQYYQQQAEQRRKDAGLPPSTFSGGGGPGGAGGAGGTGSAPSYLSGSSPGTIDLTTQAGTSLGAASAQGGAVAGSSWWQNPQLWTTILGAAQGYQGNKAAGQAGGPTNTNSTTITDPRLEDAIWGPNGILAGAQGLYGSGGKRGGGGAALPGESQQLIDYLMGKVTNPSDLYQAGSSATQSILGDQFGNNPFLAAAYAGSTGGGGSADAIMQYLNNGLPGGIGGYNSPTSAQGYTPGLGYDARTGAGGAGGSGSGGSSYSSYGGGGGSGGAAPASNGLFDQNIGDFLNWKETSPETQGVLDAQQKQANENYLLSKGELDAQAEGTGRFGGSAFAGERDQLFRRWDQDTQAVQAATLEKDLVERRNAALSALGLISERDLTREQIAAQKAIAAQSAAASSAAAARASQVQYDLGMRGFDVQEMLGTRGYDIQELLGLRGQNLDALSLMSGVEQGNLDRLSSAGGTLGSIQLGALGSIPGTEASQYAGLPDLTSLLGQKTSLGASNAARAAAAPGQNLDDFMQRILALSDRFSTRTGSSQGPAPYTPSLWSSVGTGALGGYLAGSQNKAA